MQCIKDLNFRYMCLGSSSLDGWTRGVRIIRCAIGANVTGPLLVKFVAESGLFAISAEVMNPKASVRLPSPKVLALPQYRERLNCGEQAISFYVESEGTYRCRFPNAATADAQKFCHGDYSCAEVAGATLNGTSCELKYQTNGVDIQANKFITVIVEGMKRKKCKGQESEAQNFQGWMRAAT